MAKVLVDKDFLEDGLELICGKIRLKTGGSGLLAFPVEIAQAVESIDVSGDTSDATATAGDIRTGKTAYAGGAKITGTLAEQGAQTITPGTTDQEIAAGKILTGKQTIKGDANLVASKIKKDVTIFGVTGTYAATDTSDATAAAGDIRTGKTAYVNGSKVTGTLAEKGAQTYTPGTVDQTITSGKILTGAQTIKGDAMLSAGNIKNGVTIFGVTGTYGGTAGIMTANSYQLTVTNVHRSGTSNSITVSLSGVDSSKVLGVVIGHKADASYASYTDCTVLNVVAMKSSGRTDAVITSFRSDPFTTGNQYVVFSASDVVITTSVTDAEFDTTGNYEAYAIMSA